MIIYNSFRHLSVCRQLAPALALPSLRWFILFARTTNTEWFRVTSWIIEEARGNLTKPISCTFPFSIDQIDH